MAKKSTKCKKSFPSIEIEIFIRAKGGCIAYL